MPHVLYTHCRTVLTHSNCNANKSSSGMTKHLKGCKLYSKSIHNNQVTTSATITDLFDRLESNLVMSWDHLKEKVLRIIVSGNLLFLFENNVELHALLKDAYLNCPLPTRKTARDYLQSQIDATILMVKAKLTANDFKVSLVLDTWTTRSNLSFLSTSPFCVIGHRLQSSWWLFSRYLVTGW